MKSILLSLILAAAVWGDIFIVDGAQRVQLAPVERPKADAQTMASLPHIQRNKATLTLIFEGEEYNHRHLNVRTATLDAHPVHTVLTEYSEQIAPQRHRITFDGYTFRDALMLQVYYCGEWFAVMLDPLDEER